MILLSLIGEKTKAERLNNLSKFTQLIISKPQFVSSGFAQFTPQSLPSSLQCAFTYKCVTWKTGPTLLSQKLRRRSLVRIDSPSGPEERGWR